MSSNNLQLVKRKLENMTSSPNKMAPVVRAEYINPFIESVNNLFHTMLDCHVHREKLALNLTVQPSRDIVGLVGLSGNIQGIVSIAFPVKTAMKLVGTLYHEELVVVDEKVTDAIAEVVNIVAGGAQAIINQNMNKPIELSIPTVIRGNRFTINYPKLTSWIEIPFYSDLGEFMIRVTINSKEI